MRALELVAAGPLATVQDLGRSGLGPLGVGVSGAADRTALRLANRLVGNEEGAAGIEVTFGGCVVSAHGDLFVAVTGAPCPTTVSGRSAGANSVLMLRDGAELWLGAPAAGLRSYLAVRGGIAVPPVLGSRSTDMLSGIGPAVLSAGSTLPVGPAPATPPVVDLAPVPAPAAGDVELRVVAGPRADWFTDDARAALLAEPFEVTTQSNRVGMRLAGPTLARSRPGELPSEGMVPGALQVPSAGQPTLFLSDHPVTGGYPVIALVVAADVDRAAQARPGQRLWFRQVPGPPMPSRA